MPRMIRSWVTSSAAMSQRLHRAPVADDRRRVGDLGDLVELVGDHDAGDAPASLSWRSRPSRCSESSSLSAAVGSSRISRLHLLGQRLGDLDELLLADAELDDRGDRVSCRPTRASSSAASALARFQSIRPRRHPLVAEEDVLRDRQVGHQRELLVDDDDARAPRSRGSTANCTGFAVEDDLAVVGAVTGRRRTAPSSGSTCRRRSRRRWRGSRRARPRSRRPASAVTPGNVFVMDASREWVSSMRPDRPSCSWAPRRRPARASGRRGEYAGSGRSGTAAWPVATSSAVQ